MLGLQLGALILLGAGLAWAATPSGDGGRLARLLNGEIPARAFARLTGAMDPAMLSLARRVEPSVAPAPVPPTAPVEAAADPRDADAAVIRLQDLSPDAARAWNAANPVASLPNPPAQPFHLKTEGVMDEARAVDCMTAAIYYEAGQESAEGQRAVAQVVLNRMRHPAFPKTVCGVVFQGSNRATGCQFTFTCDGALARAPASDAWGRARRVAEAALHGAVMAKVGNATHYHASYVAPYWSPSLVKVGTIGAHVFYRWTGDWGRPPAFAGRYAGGEAAGLQIATLDGLDRGAGRLALAANAAAPPQAHESPAVEPVAPAAPVLAKAPELVAAAPAVLPEAPIVKPEDLDWTGQPKKRGPPRLAMPGAASGF